MPFEAECSVILARGADGGEAVYPVQRNEHRDGILRRTTVPAGLPPGLEEQAAAIARRLAGALDLVGLLAVELFLADGRLLFNEMAPRPHNSGHWSMDFAVTGQFEQLVRAVCGLPLGDPSALCPAEMVNLIGHDADGWPAILADPGARLHLYGKAEARPGRKMGHVTRRL